jgi:hypothetical protein
MNSFRLTLLLVLLNFIIAYRLFSLYTHDNGLIQPAATNSARMDLKLPEIPLHEAGNAFAFTDIAERPLFSESRRPEPVEEEAVINANEQGTDASEYTLIGIVMSSENSQALLLKPDREVERVMLGDSIDGWELKSIGADRAIFVRGDKNRELLLDRTAPDVPNVRRRAILNRR